MRYITSRTEMQQIDAYSIEEIGIPGIVLMERAALTMEEEIRNRFSTDVRILIVTERGNNGGDGLALGRLLIDQGYKVTIYEIGGVPRASESYVIQHRILDNLGIPVMEQLPVDSFDVIIDAIFGVGLTREVKGIQAEVIDVLNQREGYKIALDVPSGVAAESGKILGTAFEADLTITVGLSKIGLELYPGARYAGEVIVKEIGFPKIAVSKIGPSAYTYDRSDLSRLPERKPWSNKGSYGKVLIVAGSKNMAGAACLCGEAAYRSGSGLVRIFTCEENRLILQNQLPEAILTTYEDEEDALDKLPEAIAWASVIGFGPGLGMNELTGKMLQILQEKATVPIVIDADGMNALAHAKKIEESFEKMSSQTEAMQADNEKEMNSEVMQTITGKEMSSQSAVWKGICEYPHGIIYTPHLMEMSRLCGRSVREIKEKLIDTAQLYADEKHIMVLKDARSIVSDGSSKTYINTSGNHGMSVGGSGDVLTGMICGLLAGGCELAEAARLGTYCHGLAGDEAAKEVGYHGLLARDLIQGITRVLS